MRVDVVLEVLPRDPHEPGPPTYRVWNSERCAPLTFGAGSRAGGRALGGCRSPLSGPVGRGQFPASSPPVSWAAAADEGTLIEVDAAAGTYRTIRLGVSDFDSLQPALTTQAPLAFVPTHEGNLGGVSRCAAAQSAAGCRAQAPHCGWCAAWQGGAAPPACVRGGTSAPCDGDCVAWQFYDHAQAPAASAGARPGGDKRRGGSTEGRQLQPVPLMEK